jgi:hypothetical protein
MRLLCDDRKAEGEDIVVAYIIFIKEKTKNQAEVELYKQMAPAGMAGHPIASRMDVEKSSKAQTAKT